MASFRTRQDVAVAPSASSRGSSLLVRAAGLLLLWGLPFPADAQHQPQGFAVERFYPSAPGAGWFVMDDLNISGGLGGAIELTSGYAHKPLEVTSPDGTHRLTVVSDEAFVDLGAASVYDRYRVYLNFPVPYLVTGDSGTLGPFQLNAPNVTLGNSPDAVADPRLGFDARLLGRPGAPLRLGASAQLIFPVGARSDYVTDGRYRAMFRFLVAGDSGALSYAGQLGVHVRPLNDAPAPGSPNGSEFLFGGSAGGKFPLSRSWAVIAGPEIFGETAFNSLFSSQQTGVEGLITGRFESTGHGRNVRIKLGIGHGIVQHFAAPEWRVLAGVELFGQRPGKGD